jgi:hypothetical protein
MGNEEDSYKEKDIAFYSATVNAWYTTKFEKDKHLLYLSTAGVGLLGKNGVEKWGQVYG